MKKIVRYIQRIVENVIIQIITLLVFTSGIVYVFSDKIFHFASQSIPVWLALICVVIMMSLIHLFQRKKSRSFSSCRKRTGYEEERVCVLWDVTWLAYFQNSLRGIRKRDEYVWVTGPFCPTCNFKLTWKEGLFGIRYSWLCEGCKKKYKRPRKKREEMIKHVENIYKADIFRKNKFKTEQCLSTGKN